ncbi:MAG: hypothetical protein RL014_1521 [Pseudomonadota bacterium]|jgi:phospholipid transport system transporter-binding protein
MTILALPARLTHAEAGPCATALVAQVLQFAGQGNTGPGATVAADASALQHFDSSALAVLLECGRAAQRAGARLVVRGLPERLRALAALYGVAELLPEA